MKTLEEYREKYGAVFIDRILIEVGYIVRDMIAARKRKRRKVRHFNNHD